MFKSFLKLAVIMMVTMAVTYFLAGIVAQNILGARAYYPPSPTALGYLRDPSAPGMQLKIWPAQLLRGLLFAVAFFPFRQRLLQLGTWKGGAALSSVIFIVGYLAASGGMIEHFLWFNDYPA
ncbi:MAG TPA: hypothetical protein VMJ64_06035, partial [Anaerolineales bacterium]|nr:hypothetical protein [Anaerolineales bacterium]